MKLPRWLRVPSLEQVLRRRDADNRAAQLHWETEAVRFWDHAERAKLDAENADSLAAMYRRRVELSAAIARGAPHNPHRPTQE